MNACDLSAFDEILFCNFFYLHRTENMVIKNIYDRAQVVLFMQGDQRRWPALSSYRRNFWHPDSRGQGSWPTAFDLKIYEAFDSHAQAGLVNADLSRAYEPVNQQSLFCRTGIFF